MRSAAIQRRPASPMAARRAGSPSSAATAPPNAGRARRGEDATLGGDHGGGARSGARDHRHAGGGGLQVDQTQGLAEAREDEQIGPQVERGQRLGLDRAGQRHASGREAAERGLDRRAGPGRPRRSPAATARTLRRAPRPAGGRSRACRRRASSRRRGAAGRPRPRRARPARPDGGRGPPRWPRSGRGPRRAAGGGSGRPRSAGRGARPAAGRRADSSRRRGRRAARPAARRSPRAGRGAPARRGHRRVDEDVGHVEGGRHDRARAGPGLRW